MSSTVSHSGVSQFVGYFRGVNMYVPAKTSISFVFWFAFYFSLGVLLRDCTETFWFQLFI